MSATKDLALEAIRIDGGTQARVRLSIETVEEYAERYKAGDEFPLPIVYFDGSEYWLADGFQRYHAQRTIGRKKIKVRIEKGTVRDAILFAAGANTEHGLRRTSEDKRHAVKMLLADKEWAKRSNRWIAEQCGVGDQLVATVRDSIQLRDSRSCEPDEEEETRIGRDGKERRLPTIEEQAVEDIVSALKPILNDPDMPQPRPAVPLKERDEPNTIGVLKERVADFMDGIISGQPAHVRAVLADYLEELAAAMRQ